MALFDQHGGDKQREASIDGNEMHWALAQATPLLGSCMPVCTPPGFLQRCRGHSIMNPRVHTYVVLSALATNLCFF